MPVPGAESEMYANCEALDFEEKCSAEQKRFLVDCQTKQTLKEVVFIQRQDTIQVGRV